MKFQPYRKFVKRPLDFVLALIGIVVFSPVLVVVAVLVRVKLGSPVVFVQERPGKDEKIFKMYKFRTMTEERDDDGELLSDEVRLTKFGRMLRATSLDELPGLVNVFKGDMALVGPRPLAVKYLPYYNQSEKIRHSVLPGLTGLAQVNGRNSISWEEKFAHDIEYVKTQSLLVDISIVFKTIKKVIMKSDIGERGMDLLIDFDEHRKLQKNTSLVCDRDFKNV